MKIDKGKLLKTSTSVRAYWIEDDTSVVLYTTTLMHDVYVAHIPSANTEGILRFMKNIDEVLRNEFYFIVSDDIENPTIDTDFNVSNLTSEDVGKLVVVGCDDEIEIVPVIKEIALKLN